MGEGPGTHVDTGGLRDFAGQVRGRTDGTLIEGSNQVYGQFGRGVVFGHGMDVSPVVRKAQERCHTILESGHAGYSRFIAEAQWLAATVEHMAKTYGDTDWASAATADQIKETFDQGRTQTAGGGQPSAATADGPDAGRV